MSFHHVSWVAKNPTAKGVQRLTLLVLAHHANDLDESYPSVATIAREANVSRRGVQTSLRGLEEDGLIRQIGPHPDPRYHGAIVYRLPDPEGGADSAPAQSTTSGGRRDCAQKEVKKKEGCLEEPSLKRSQEAARPTATQLEREAVDRVWAYYLELIPSKRQLDPKRRRIIANAIHLVGEEQVKLALLGLSRSPFHNGQNDQRRPYLEVRYALKGIGDESDDERIEKAITWASIYAPTATPVDEVKVQRWLDDLRYTLSLPHHPEPQRGREAYQNLRALGFQVEKLDAAPWVRISR